MFTLFDWQQNDVEAIINAGGSGIIASETGAGKTLIAVEVAKRLNAQSVLVIGPKSTRRSWESTFNKQWPSLGFQTIENTSAGRMALSHLAFGKAGAYFIGIEFFRTLGWQSYKIDMVIADEIHKMGNRETKGAQALSSTIKAKHRLALSATLMRNNLENLWTPIKWVYPDLEHWFPDEDYFIRHPELSADMESKHSMTKETRYVPHPRSGRMEKRPIGRRFDSLSPRYFWQFAELFFKITDDFFKGLVIERERIAGEVLGLAPAYIRHLKREQCCEYHPTGFATWPKPRQEEILLPMTTKQKQIYKQITENSIVWLQDHPMSVSLPLTERLRKAQVGLAEVSMDAEGNIIMADDAKSAKLDWILESVTDGDLVDEQFVLFTSSQKFAQIAARRIPGAFEWSGKAATQAERDAAMLRFISGELRVIVAVIAASGTGTDGFQVASNFVWADYGSDITDREQAMGRGDRTGQKLGVTNYLLISEGTEEAGIIDKQQQKQLVLNKALKAGK